MTKKLNDRVCLVTGASRGVGKGVAIALGEAGATVYITGRTLEPTSPNRTYSECLLETARLIEKNGGKAIPVAVDHSDDHQVAALFGRIRREQDGRLDILVNSAHTSMDYLLHETGPEAVYWEPNQTVRSPSDEWDLINRVGLRNAYTCCVLATRMMVEHRANYRKKKLENGIANGANAICTTVSKYPTGAPPTGVIINISSLGGFVRVFNVAFCAGKSALDRMSVEMARDLNKRSVDVAVFSLIPGVVQTEAVIAALEQDNPPELLKQAISIGLGIPPHLPGHVISELVGQRRESIIKQSGRCLMVSDMARQFALYGYGKRYPKDPRAIKTILQLAGWKRLAILVPEFVKMPYWAIAVLTSKF